MPRQQFADVKGLVVSKELVRYVHSVDCVGDNFGCDAIRT